MYVQIREKKTCFSCHGTFNFTASGQCMKEQYKVTKVQSTCHCSIKKTSAIECLESFLDKCL